MNEDNIKSLLTLLESLPPTPSVTFRGYVDTSITEPRAISSPVLTATSHNISIATNNLAGSSPVEWCNRFVSFGLGYALSWSGVSSCWVGCGVSRDLVRMSRLR